MNWKLMISSFLALLTLTAFVLTPNSLWGSSSRLTLTDLYQKVSRDKDLTNKEAQRAVRLLFKEMKKGLKKGKSVNIRGFGTFYISRHSSRTWKNPKTKKIHKIPARNTVGFRPSRILKDEVNQN